MRLKGSVLRKLNFCAKVLGLLVVVVVAGVVAGVSVLKSMNFNDFKKDIEILAKDATGRDVSIRGDLKLNISLAPSLNMSDVTVGNAPWGGPEPMIVLKNLKAKVDLASLLSGVVDVNYFVVDGLSLVLETDGKGKANWEFEGEDGARTQVQSSGGLSIIPRVHDVRLNNVDLTYIDGATQSRLKVKLDKMNVKAETYDSPMGLDVKAVYAGVNFDVQSQLGSLKHLIGTKGGAFPVHLTVKAKGLSLKIDGGVEQPQTGMNVDVQVVAEISNMDTVSQLAGTDLSLLKSVKAKMRVTGHGTTYTFSDLNMKAAGSDMAGKVAVDLAQKRLKVSGALRSNVLNVDALRGPKKSSQTPSSKVFTTTPISLQALKSVDLDVSYTAKQIVLKPFDISTLKARAKLTAGRLDVSTFKAKVDGGDVGGRLVLNGSQPTPSVSVDLSLNDLDVGRILVDFGVGKWASLKVNGHVKAISQGRSTQSMASNLNGSVRLQGRGGRIFDGAIEGLGATVINCFVGRLPIKNGEVSAKTVLLDTPAFGAQVTGNIDLPGERLHLTVVPKAKTTSLASFAVPVRIKGTLKAPYIGFDATEAVAGTVGNIVKAPIGVLLDIFGISAANQKKAPCVQALEQAN